MREKCKPLQTVRALLFLGIFAYHIGIHYFSFLWAGVEIFFAISGYYIFEKIVDKNKELNLKNMVAKRVRRLFLPDYLIVTLCTVFCFCIIGRPTLVSIIETCSFIVGVNNLYWLVYGLEFCTMLAHMWTVAIEFQAILIIAFIVYVLRKVQINIETSIYIIMVISIGYVLTIPYYFQNNFLYSLLPISHMISFGLGGVAYLIRKKCKNVMWYGIIMSALGVGGIITIGYYLSVKNQVGIIAALLSLSSATPNILQGRFLALIYCFIALIGAGVILVCYGIGENSLIGKLMSNKVMVSIGDNSFLLYLWHYPLLKIVWFFMPKEHSKIMTLMGIMCAFGTTFVLAYVQKYIIKKLKCIKRKR